MGRGLLPTGKDYIYIYIYISADPACELLWNLLTLELESLLKLKLCFSSGVRRVALPGRGVGGGTPLEDLCDLPPACFSSLSARCAIATLPVERFRMQPETAQHAQMTSKSSFFNDPGHPFW